MRFRRILWGILLGVLIIPLAFLLALIILITWVTLSLIDIPNKLGKALDLEGALRDVIYGIIDESELEYFRDEYMEVIQSNIEYIDGLERWGLLREIDLEKERAINDLQQGEQIFAILGTFLTVVVGTIFGLSGAALALTFIILLYSIAVAFRVLVVDSLAYSSIHHRNATIRELAKMKAWNEGPLRGTGGVGVVLVSLITSRRSWGSDLGFKVADVFTPVYFDYDEDKWRDSRDTE